MCETGTVVIYLFIYLKPQLEVVHKIKEHHPKEKSKLQTHSHPVLDPKYRVQAILT
jgi:hypothetical protein